MVPLRVAAPAVAVFAVFLVMLAASRRAPQPRTRTPIAWRRWIRVVIWTAAGGYLVFLAAVAVFHELLSRERGALANALTDGAALAVLVVPSFVLLSAVEAAVRARLAR